MTGINTLSKTRNRADILFLQLPLLDNDTSSNTENIPLAAQYLTASAAKAGESRYFNFLLPDKTMNRLDNKHITEEIIRLRPRAVAATLYLWNVERTINVLQQVRRHLPDLLIMAGGPEVAKSHPFLYKSLVADVAVCGEGEPAFPLILRSIRTATRTDLQNVAWRSGKTYMWGSTLPPEPPLQSIIPHAHHPANHPDSNGIAYMETVRGCPFKCSFCRYGQQRRKVSRLPHREVISRIKILQRRGASEIRFIDPTFNARPDFHSLLSMIAGINRNHKLKFFAELKADSISSRTADLLAQANVKEVEVGVQSISPAVLKAVNRPPDSDRVLHGIKLLAAHGIETTLDVMCGLPEQTAADVREALTRLSAIPRSRIQLLHTLLIPGSPLRDNRSELGLHAQPLPPYRVLSTRTMTGNDMLAMDNFAARLLGARLDNPAPRFVSYRLPGLFREQITIDLNPAAGTRILPGRENRRALIFKHNNLFANADVILSSIEQALNEEPDILWQFVLSPATEEPLDLIDAIIKTIDRAPAHFMDRLHARRPGTSRCARRIFIRLQKNRRYDTAWQTAAEELLSRNFY